jgi:hypothetical protein
VQRGIHPSLVKIFSLQPCSQTPSVYAFNVRYQVSHPYKTGRIMVLYTLTFADPSAARSAAAWLLGSRVRIPLGAWMFVSCLYVVLSCVGRGLCDGLITRSEGSYNVSDCMCDDRNSESGPMFQVGNDKKMNDDILTFTFLDSRR